MPSRNNKIRTCRIVTPKEQCRAAEGDAILATIFCWFIIGILGLLMYREVGTFVYCTNAMIPSSWAVTAEFFKVPITITCVASCAFALAFFSKDAVDQCETIMVKNSS